MTETKAMQELEHMMPRPDVNRLMASKFGLRTAVASTIGGCGVGRMICHGYHK